MSIVLQQLSILFIFAFMGYILAKVGVIKAEQTKILSSLIVYVFCPAVCLDSFSKNFTTQYLSQKYKILIVSVVVLIFLSIAALLASKLFSKDAYDRNVYTYSLIVPNYGYMGYALAVGIFGDEMLMDVIIVGIPLTIFIYAIGLPMLTGVKNFSIKKLINPPIVTIVIGVIIGLTNIKIPEIFQSIFTEAGGCMAPLAMLIMGITISEFKLSELFKKYKIYVLALLRLIIIPLIIATVLWFVLPKEFIIPVLLVYILPCGLNTVVFPRLVGKNCEIGAGVALISSLFSIITIPLWLNFFV